MTGMIGMNPDEVDAHRSALTSQLGALESALAAVHRVRLASLNPLDYSIVPGALILAPAAIVTTMTMAALVARAKSNAEQLVGQLLSQVAQQRDVSAARGGALSPVAGEAAGSSASTLALLASMSPAQLKQLLKDDPALAQEFWNNPPDAQEVASWWKSLTPAEQAQLVKDAPTIIGNLNGVPYAERDAANRDALEAAAHDPNLTQEQKDAVRNIGQALKGAKGGGQRYLVDFNVRADPPLAAVAIGDVDKADDVTVDVPGMNTYTKNSMTSWTDAAQNLYGQEGLIDPGHSHAVIAWIGYKTPPFDASVVNPHASDSVMSNTLAQDGAPRLAADLDGIHDTRAGEGAAAAHVSVVAHSYGTTTSAYALTQTKHDVNSVDFVASAGIDTKVVPNAEAMHVDSVNGHEQVYASQATRDGIATSGRFGSHRGDPENSSFGAILYSSDGGKAPDGTTYASVNGHDTIGSGPALPPYSVGTGHGYFDSGTQSLYNIAVVSSGHGTLLGGLKPQLF